MVERMEDTMAPSVVLPATPGTFQLYDTTDLRRLDSSTSTRWTAATSGAR